MLETTDNNKRRKYLNIFIGDDLANEPASAKLTYFLRLMVDHGNNKFYVSKNVLRRYMEYTATEANIAAKFVVNNQINIDDFTIILDEAGIQNHIDLLTKEGLLTLKLDL